MSLIHIPLSLYQKFLPNILRLLFPVKLEETAGRFSGADISWVNAYPFVNVSVTPIEASVVCPRSIAQKLFVPEIDEHTKQGVSGRPLASLSTEDYVVISVVGGGSEASQRVLELTGPLALAGM